MNTQAQFLIPAVVEPVAAESSVATSCVACAQAHLATVSGLLKEALRFARTDGVDNHEVVVRINSCLEEIGALERHDWAPERLLASPEQDQAVVRRFQEEVRTLRQSITQIDTSQTLEQVAAQAANLSVQFSTEVIRSRSANVATLPHAVSPPGASSLPTADAVWAELAQLWTETTGDPQIRIAVLDGDVDQTHACFEGAVMNGEGIEYAPGARHGQATRHGTAISSLIFGQHGSPIRGVAPSCTGLIVPIFAEDEAGRVVPALQPDLAKAITRAVESGAHVINVSGGESSPNGQADPALLAAIQLCEQQNVLLVSSTGNGGCECLQVPAAAHSVLAVGAVTEGGQPASFSNWGGAYQSQGVLAPGEQLTVAKPGGGAGSESGTSLAAGFVSGVAGLLLSMQVKQGQQPNPLGVREAILATAHRCDPTQLHSCERFLVGVINVAGAAERIRAAGAQPAADIGPGDSDAAAGEAPESAGWDPAMEAEVAVIEGRDVSMEFSHGDELSGIAPQTALPLSGVRPAQSGDGLVYVLGQIGVDFGIDARLDGLKAAAGGQDVSDPAKLLALLERMPYLAADIGWTLTVDGVPVYALTPRGAYAPLVFERLREFVQAQHGGGVERVSIAGQVTGQTVRLRSGQEVALLVPELRSMYSWRTEALVSAVMAAAPPQMVEEHNRAHLTNFMNRVYYELRNFGSTPSERALNFAVTNAFQIGHVFSEAAGRNMELSAINVEASPLSRPGSDCWDVKLTFFSPDKVYQEAKREYRFTIDVSDVVPVAIGPVRSWSVF